VLIFAWLVPDAIAAEPVRVLAAFTLKPALDEIAEGYREGGGEVVLVYGPSPGLASRKRGAGRHLLLRGPDVDG
jgi:hypothetical protein